jgi:cytoplasmic iron level regulating protein YaaA (DUF328/UPF0246 family)
MDKSKSIMLILTSPAKTLNQEKGKDFHLITEPKFKKEALQLVRILKKKKQPDLKQLMSISDKLAFENFHRFKSFQKSFSTENSNPAIFAFQGDVYLGLDVESLTKEQLISAQNRIRILSGLYGVLRPLDLMQPYRLEMGTKLENSKGKNIYAFWGTKITRALNQDIKEYNHQNVLNLASNEYFKAVQIKKLKAPLLTANFKEFRNGELKFISFSAKKARGMMMHYIISNNIINKEELKGFDYDGYTYNQDFSTATELIFTREVI